MRPMRPTSRRSDRWVVVPVAPVVPVLDPGGVSWLREAIRNLSVLWELRRCGARRVATQ